MVNETLIPVEGQVGELGIRLALRRLRLKRDDDHWAIRPDTECKLPADEIGPIKRIGAAPGKGL